METLTSTDEKFSRPSLVLEVTMRDGNFRDLLDHGKHLVPVLEVTMRDGNSNSSMLFGIVARKRFRSDYEGWKLYFIFIKVNKIANGFRSDYEGWKLATQF